MPDSRPDLSFTCRAESETQYLARQLAQCSGTGDTLLLSGPIGAGKSVFARAFIRACLEPFDTFPDVPSPTYTLVQTYHAGETEIWHADLYRLDSVQDAVELSLQDAFGEAVCLIEWPEILEPLLPKDATRICFEHVSGSPEARLLRFQNVNGRFFNALAAAGAEAEQ